MGYGIGRVEVKPLNIPPSKEKTKINFRLLNAKKFISSNQECFLIGSNKIVINKNHEK